MRALELALLATFIPGACAKRLKASGAIVLNRPDMEPLKPSFYGSKAWRATHAVNIGMEFEGFILPIEMGGSTIDSAYKESPKACGDVCEETEGCVAWSWNKVDKNCYAQNSCERRVPNTNMVSGLKSSFQGLWYFKRVSDVAVFSIDRPKALVIDVDQKGEMILKMVDTDQISGGGKLEKASGSRHGVEQRGDELEVRLIGTHETNLGTMRLQLADGKLKAWLWLPEEENPVEFTAEKKEVVFEPFQRVTIKEDQVIAASIHRSLPDFGNIMPFTLNRRDGGTVVKPSHPHKTGVIFDRDQDLIVWVSDALLVKTTLLEEVSEEEVKDVLENLGDDLILAITDPITTQIIGDPVKAANGYTYERHSIAQVDSKLFSPDFTIRSLVSSVIEKVNAARAAKPRSLVSSVVQKINSLWAAKPTLPEEVSDEEVKDVLKNLGDQLVEAISDPITWNILRDPVKAADGFTYERSSIEDWIWRAQAHGETPKNQFGTPLSSVELTPDYTMRSLVSSVSQKVKIVRDASSRIQKHWRGFQVRKGTSQLGANLALVKRQMEYQRRQISSTSKD